jgi:peroxiredoxin
MAIEIGDIAPDFELVDQHGTKVRLSDFRGQKNVVLVFYPLAFSNVCEDELCSIRDELADLDGAEDTQVLTVSVDSMFTHRAWANQQKYKFPLLSDFWPHGAVSASYGVFNEQLGAAVRGTFVIDRSGTVRWKVVNSIPDARDVNEYRAALTELA